MLQALVLRHWMETRGPGGAGQKQPGRLCAEHDSPPGRPATKKSQASPANTYTKEFSFKKEFRRYYCGFKLL